jgi:hypothetical protein
MVSINCFIERAKRSSFHTISVSPLRANSPPNPAQARRFSAHQAVSTSRCQFPIRNSSILSNGFGVDPPPRKSFYRFLFIRAEFWQWQFLRAQQVTERTDPAKSPP